MPVDGYLRFVLALAFVLALIAGLAWLYRRYGQGRVAAPRRRPGGLRNGLRGSARGGRRLGVVEAVALDSRRRLVLVRRDDREHLIIVGNQGETVVEAGIVVEDGRTLDAHETRFGDAGPADDRADHADDTETDGPSARRAERAARPTSFLRLVRETTRAPS